MTTVSIWLSGKVLVLASTVILGFWPRGTRDHIFVSQESDLLKEFEYIINIISTRKGTSSHLHIFLIIPVTDRLQTLTLVPLIGENFTVTDCRRRQMLKTGEKRFVFVLKSADVSQASTHKYSTALSPLFKASCGHR
jgi:hypothetical protein